MVDFCFQANKKLVFGAEKTAVLPSLLPSLASPTAGSLLLVSGRTVTKSPRWQELYSALEEAGYSVVHKTVSGEPSPGLIDKICDDCRSHSPALVVALGGGSVLDAGKAVSAMLCEKEGVTTFLEGVGTKNPSGRKLPFAALPTTAGTGSECTKNAVLSSPGPEGFKKSLRHDNYIPDLALIDPLWLSDLPRETAASCGMDAFSQLLESYLSTAASPVTDALALEGLKGFLSSFGALLQEEASTEDLSAIALGASLSGLTLANAGLGTVHGLAGALGGLMPVPHGTACGLLMPVVMKRTFKGLAKTDPRSRALKKASGLGALLLPDEKPEDERALEALIARLEDWAGQARLPGLKELGADESILVKAASAGGNKNNPYTFTEEECLEILKSI